MHEWLHARTAPRTNSIAHGQQYARTMLHVQPDAATLDADQDHPGPARLTEPEEHRLVHLALHLPVIPQILDPVPH